MHPELPYITHGARCAVCAEYGAHLALASVTQARTYQRARYDLVDSKDRLLQRRSVDDAERLLARAENDNTELRAANNRLLEENEILRAKLASLGSSSNIPQTRGASSSSTLNAPPAETSSSRGRAWGLQAPPQRQLTGRPPIPRSHKDTSLTTSMPAPHESTHDDFTNIELEEPRPLQERFSNHEQTLDNIKGQLFPDLDGTEQPFGFHILGEERNDGQLKALFFRFNERLYAYVGDSACQAYENLRLGVPPLLPMQRSRRLVAEKMGPIHLYNTTGEIRELYARAAREEDPNCAPHVQAAQDLNLYLHLWNSCKQVKSNVMHLAMKAWRPPAWAAELAKQKKLALREKGRALQTTQQGGLQPKPMSSTTNDPSERPGVKASTTGTIPPTTRSSLGDRITSPEPGEVTTRCDSPDRHQRGPTASGPSSSQAPTGRVVAPIPKRKGKGKSKPSDDFPPDAPHLSDDVGTWVRFIHQWQLGRTHAEDERAGNRVFPGVLRSGPYDDSDAEPPAPLTRAVRGLLLVQRLMPQSQYNMGRNAWRRMAARLFGVAGRYCSLISWTGYAPALGGVAQWFGVTDGSVFTLGRLAAYFAANGVTYENADDLWVWGRNHMEELRNRYMCSESPEAVTLLAEINADRDICDMTTQASARSLEYYRGLTAASGGGPYDSALPTSGECEDDPLLQRQVADAVDLYPLPLAPRAPGSSSHMDVDVPMDPSQESECDMGDLFEPSSM